MVFNENSRAGLFTAELLPLDCLKKKNLVCFTQFKYPHLAVNPSP